MSNILIETLKEIFSMPQRKVEELLKVCTIETHAKNEMVVTKGKTFNRLGYIIHGAARIYYSNERGEEVSYLLQVNGDVIGDYAGFITGAASEVKIEILLPTEVLYLEKNQLDTLIQKDIFWLFFAKQLSDMAFLSAKQRLDELFFYTPEQRYLNLIKKSPEILNKIPQKYISSYLGITPPSLSRIRKRIFDI